MSSLITLVIASTAPVNVPDSGLSAVLFASGVLAVGVAARFIKNRRK
jgi:hypothetical protein